MLENKNMIAFKKRLKLGNINIQQNCPDKHSVYIKLKVNNS